MENLLSRFECEPAATEKDRDQLLLALLRKHPEGDGRWVQIEKEFNRRSSSVKSKRWVQNRSKKLGEKALSLPSAGMAAEELQTTVSAGCTFEEFKQAWTSRVGDAQALDCNLVAVYAKFKHISVEELQKVLLATDPRRPRESDDKPRLVPAVRTADYIDGVRKKAPFQTLVIDEMHLLHLFCMTRVATTKTSNGSYHSDQLALSLDVQEGVSDLGRNVAAAFGNISLAGFEIRDHHGEAITVHSHDCCVLPRLVLTSFVEVLQKRLRVSRKDELIVVPYKFDELFATRSSSTTGCCMIGDFSDATADNIRNVSCFVSSVPFRIKSMDKSRPEMELLRDGKLPVTWELYPFFGQEPMKGMRLSDGIVRYPVPRSESQANSFLTKMRTMGQRPQITEVRGSPDAFCGECFDACAGSIVCSCGMAAYCSGSCAKKHRNVHGLICPIPWKGLADFQAMQRRAELELLPDKVFQLNDIGEGWDDYFARRGIVPRNLHVCTTALTVPLTILMAMRRFKLTMKEGAVLRIDLPGSSGTELLDKELVFAELGRALHLSSVIIRLVGPDLEAQPPVTVQNVSISCHKMMYEDFLGTGTEPPHLAVACNAGIRESWYPAIARLLELKIPTAITGYDLRDVAGGLVDLNMHFTPRPHVIVDGENPFASCMRLGLQAASEHPIVTVRKIKGTPIEKHPVVAEAAKYEKELQAETVRITRDMMRVSDGALNKCWFLFQGVS